MPSPRIFLVHWHEADAAERAARLRKLGYRVDYGFTEGGDPCRQIKADVPAIVVIDLGRLPSHGRATALALRESKKTRRVPLVFVDGVSDKVERVREMFPDATFATWSGIGAALLAAQRDQPANPVVPRSTSGYSGTPLPRKLGIKPGALVTTLGAPEGFAATLGTLPEGAKLTTRLSPKSDVVVLFARTLAELKRALPGVAKKLPDKASLWLAWPKQTSALHRDLGEDQLREIGLATGLVDIKVCAIDADWSGLRFTHRRT